MAETPREALAKALDAMLSPEQLSHLIDEVLAINKRVSTNFACKFCERKQMQYVEVPDAKAVALALPDLLNQAYGRPQEASQQTDPVVFKRLTILSDDEELERAIRLVEENRRRHADERRQNGALREGRNGAGPQQDSGDPHLQIESARNAKEKEGLDAGSEDTAD